MTNGVPIVMSIRPEHQGGPRGGELGFAGQPNDSKRKAVTRRAREGNSEVSDLDKKLDDRVRLD